jgi:hypothetical protein
MYTIPLYQELARKINGALTANEEWREVFAKDAKNLVDMLPHGSGIDGDTKIDWDRSMGDNIVINASYHHMDDSGTYDGWTDFSVVVKPSLQYGLDVTVRGKFPRKYADTRDYLIETFQCALSARVTQEIEGFGLLRTIRYDFAE